MKRICSVLLLAAMLFCTVCPVQAEETKESGRPDETAAAVLDWVLDGSNKAAEIILKNLDESEAIFAAELNLFFSDVKSETVFRNVAFKASKTTDETWAHVPGVLLTGDDGGEEEKSARVTVYITSQGPLDSALSEETRELDLGTLTFGADASGEIPESASMTLLDKDLQVIGSKNQLVQVTGSEADTTPSEPSTPPSGGGGGGGGQTTYPVEVSSFTGGTVRISRQRAAKGDTVTVTATPEAGYRLAVLRVTDENGSEIAVTEGSGGKYTFKMPGGPAYVTVSFASESGSSAPGSDGTAVTQVTDENGKVTSVEVVVPDNVRSTVLPQEVPLDTDVHITAGKDAETEVTIPVEGLKPGFVALDENGRVIRDCAWTGEGIRVTVSGKAKVRIVDRSAVYTDTASAAWAEDAIQFVTSRELFAGVGNSQFAPAVPMNRGMMVTVLYRLAYEPEAGAPGFPDVAAGQYYAKAVDWASKNGVVAGYDSGLFGPEDMITRQDMAAILYRYLKPEAVTDNVLESFGDADEVSDYAVEAVKWAVSTGLIKGTDSSTLSPQKTATRAEVAAIIMRYIAL